MRREAMLTNLSLRKKHAETSVGFRILHREPIKHKLFHYLLLCMAGPVDDRKVGWLPRWVLSDASLAVSSFADRHFPALTDRVVSLIGKRNSGPR